jgi:hypothetical protein
MLASYQPKSHELIIFGDLHLIKNVVESCDYTRQNLFDAAITSVLTSAADVRKKLLFSTGEIPAPLIDYYQRVMSGFLKQWASRSCRAAAFNPLKSTILGASS